MAKYHLNYKGEAGKCSATKGACPFGGNDDHFDSPESAREAYEQAHQAFAAPVTREPAQVMDDLRADASDEALDARKAEIKAKPWSYITREEHAELAAIDVIQRNRLAQTKKPLAKTADILRYEKMSKATGHTVSARELAELDGLDGADVEKRLLVIQRTRTGLALAARAHADLNPNSMGDEIAAQRLEKEAGLVPPRPVAKKTTARKPKATSWKDGATPKPADSKIIVAPAINDPQGGYMGGRLFKGGKVTDGYMPQKEAAKLIRKDIAEAIKAGELPKDLSYNVRVASGAWVTSIDIYLGMKDPASGRPGEVHETDQGEPNIVAVKQYLEALGNQYSTDDSNGMVDYYNSHNRARVSFWHKYL